MYFNYSQVTQVKCIDYRLILHMDIFLISFTASWPNDLIQCGGVKSRRTTMYIL